MTAEKQGPSFITDTGYERQQRTPPTDTTNGRAHNNSTTCLYNKVTTNGQKFATSQHLDMSRRAPSRPNVELPPTRLTSSHIGPSQICPFCPSCYSGWSPSNLYPTYVTSTFFLTGSLLIGLFTRRRLLCLEFFTCLLLILAILQR